VSAASFPLMPQWLGIHIKLADPSLSQNNFIRCLRKFRKFRKLHRPAKFELLSVTKSRVGEFDRFCGAENESGHRISSARQVFE